MLATIARRSGLIILPFGLIGAANGTPHGAALLILSVVFIIASTGRN